MYFLDTNTCIYFLNGKYESVRKRLLATAPGEIAIPALVKAELLFGAYKSRNREATVDKVERFLEPFAIKSFDDRAASEYADIRSEAERTRKTIRPNDLCIAAIVRSNQGILVTNNEKEFGTIPGLRLENWIR
jgi:tRNA(fMet)-specific endonuclease VapC